MKKYSDISTKGKGQEDAVRTSMPKDEPAAQDPGQETPHEVNTDFINEKIKARPVNRKRLLRRTLMTACLAALFGTVACVVFLVLEPVINKAMNPEEQQTITIPEETSDEITPEDMIATDEEKQKAQTEEAVSQAVSQMSTDTQALKEELRQELKEELEQELREEFSSQTSSTTGYEEIYNNLSQIAQEEEPSMVVVSGITQDTDWAGEAFDNTDKTSGLLIAQTQEGALVLVQSDQLEDAEQIRVTFSDGTQGEASMISRDTITGLCMLRVPTDSFSQEALAAMTPAVFGSSQRISLLGRPVIAVGSPMGTSGSVAYGVVTNAQLPLDMADSTYQQITTDIYGSTRAAGVLLDTHGEVVGWTDANHSAKDTPNLIQAIGITELKPLIESLSNAATMGYAGFHGGDVPESIQESQGVPAGAYISQVDMDSPAMEAGVQSGDVVTGIGNTDITDYAALVKSVASMVPGRTYYLTVQRAAGDQYEKVQLRLSAANRLEQPE